MKKDGWVEVGRLEAEGGCLEFRDVPSGGLYLLTKANSRREERIFTYENAKQVWW